MLTTNPPMIGATDATEMTPQTTQFTPSPESSNIRTQIPASVLTKATFSTSPSAAAFSEPVEEELIIPVTAQTVQSDLSSDETTLIPQSTAEDVEEVTNKTTASTVSTTMEVDLDESEPYFQRYCRTGNRIASGIGTTFLLTMILFAVTKNISKWGLVNLIDVRKVGVSFPQRPEIIVLICSTLPTIFTTIARPLFLMSNPQEYMDFISLLPCTQARQFFDLFSRTAAVYHMIYWAYRMPIIRWLWRNYLRFNAFRAVWTKEHIIEVLRDKFAPEKDDKFRKMFQNSPESMYYYAQFLQSGLPMQYLQTLMKQGNRSPSMSTTAIDGFGGQMGGHGRTGIGGTEGDVLPRVNLGHLMSMGTDDSASPKAQHYGNFLSPTGGSPSKLSNAALHVPSGGSHQISRNTSFRGSSLGRPPMPSMTFDGGFGQHLSPEDAANAIMLYERQGSMSPDMHSLILPPTFSSQEMLFPGHGMIPGFDFFGPSEKKEKEEENFIKPPTREFIYICKHALPGIIYVISLLATLPSIFGFDKFQDESMITKVYFYYDMLFIVFIPMVAIAAAFYHGVLASTQLNGGSKMRFRLRCYYVNFVILNIPMLCLMLTTMAYKIQDSDELKKEMYGTGIIIAMTAYHAQFVLKTTVYTTGCNCICCSDKCLNRHPRLRNCIITMVTPRNKPAPLPPKKKDGDEEDEDVDKYDGTPENNNDSGPRDQFGQGTEIQIMPPDAEAEPEQEPLITK
ncbi:unnamed protein product [Hymenolepis diminuta]|uniref:G_PROTEIN_RECEP_F1_2 domain-containing protein n=1 Tax=Hymenolepis diminuta TaxID=6216 RepID=A0A0R3SAM8_HYMDI|nr:unnamed protein product [Hymenolepis diminuta]